MKSKLMFLMLGIFFISLLSSVSAVVVYGEWEDGSQNAIITEGDSIDFNVDFFTMNPPMTVTIKLFDQQNQLIHTFESNTVINNPEFARDYTLSDTMYSGTGNYLVSLIGRDAYGPFSQSLNLNVQPKVVTPPTNHPPVINSAPITTLNEICPNENTPYTYDVDATDADGDKLTYSLTAAPSWLSINSTTGVISGTAPSVSADTQFQISVKVIDGKGGSDTQTYTLTIKNCAAQPPTNRAPVINSAPVTVLNEICPNEITPYTYDVDATDADGDALTYSLVTAPAWLTINSTTGVISGTAPAVSADTQFQVSVRVSDGKGGTDTQTYMLTIKNCVQSVNHAPVITSQPVTVTDETCPTKPVVQYRYDVDATDQDSDTLTYSLLESPSWLTIDSNTGVISGNVPTVSSDTQFTITVRVSDGKGGTDTQTYTLIVKNRLCEQPPANHAPVITTSPTTLIGCNCLFVYDVNATDTDGDTLTYSLTQAPSWLTINSATGVISGTTPNVNSNTTFTITVKVSDGKGGTDTQTYTLIVTNQSCSIKGNRAPIITTTPITTVHEKSKYVYDVNATDPDGDTLTYSISQIPGTPAWLKVNPTTGLITGTSPDVTSDTWTFQVTVIVSDGKGRSSAQVYSIVVHNTGHSPSPDSSSSGSSHSSTVSGNVEETKNFGAASSARQPIISQESAKVADSGKFGVKFSIAAILVGIIVAALAAFMVFSKKQKYDYR